MRACQLCNIGMACLDGRGLNHYKCENCNLEYWWYWNKPNPTGCYLADEDYRFKFNYDKNTCEIQKRGLSLISLQFNEFNVSTFEFWETIIKLNCIPKNITPQNIKAKLKTYIVFS